ncbi:MAG TPA: hypothetical protein VLC46_27605 [Thermoanaerobaculia bacterium]|nr:hypothetical protein [Thermoanaerobaculia bacterium]
MASGVALLFLTPDDRLLAAPMLSIGLTATVYMLTLWARDGSPPVFEPGTLCMLAITVYGTLPLAGFLMMHGQWDPLCDGRLQQYPFIPAELGLFGWRYAVYAMAFAATYLLVRGRARVSTMVLTIPKQASQTAIIVTFAVLYACKIGLEIIYDYDPDDFSYSDVAGSVARAMSKTTPYLILQIGHNILGALFVAELGVMILLIAYWRKRWCRYALAVWLFYEILSTVIALRSRGRIVLLLISAGLLYHRLVKPVRFRVLIAAGLLLLVGFMVLGAIRAVESREAMEERARHALTGGNEFQGLFTTAFDIHKKKEAGEIQSVPWQLYVSDVYFPIPSQFLPFEKIDPSTWYIDLIGQTGQGVGFMFGVMSQAALGLDWIELVLRAAVIAAVLAILQRWYAHRAKYFWPTLFSLFVSIWAYYSMRASTFFFIYFLVYHFIPVILAVKILERLLGRMSDRRVEHPTLVRT